MIHQLRFLSLAVLCAASLCLLHPIELALGQQEQPTRQLLDPVVVQTLNSTNNTIDSTTSRTPAATHLVKFVGLQHGHPNDAVAREELAASLGKITQSYVTIDSFDMAGTGEVTWHSDAVSECSEEQLRGLMARLRDPETGRYTRDFKMFLGPDFKHPERLESQWAGACANLDRKRTVSEQQAPAPVALSPVTGQDAAAEVPPTRSEEVNTRSELEATRPTTTPEPPVESAPTEAETPAPEATERSLLEEATEPPTGNETDTTTTSTMASLFESDFGNSLAELDTSNMTKSIFEVEPTTTTTTTSTTTTAAPTTTSSTTTAPATEAAGTPEETTTTTTTTQAPDPTDQYFRTAKTKEVTLPWPGQENWLSSSVAPIGSSSNAAIEQPEQEAAAAGATNTAYGKYVGLTTGFLIFLAYVLCARAYRRQGMFEVTAPPNGHGEPSTTANAASS